MPNFTKKYVVLYYRDCTTTEGEPDKRLVYQSKTVDRLSFPESVTIQQLAPKNTPWDFAVIEERYYRDN